MTDTTFLWPGERHDLHFLDDDELGDLQDLLWHGYCPARYTRRVVSVHPAAVAEQPYTPPKPRPARPSRRSRPSWSPVRSWSSYVPTPESETDRRKARALRAAYSEILRRKVRLDYLVDDLESERELDRARRAPPLDWGV